MALDFKKRSSGVGRLCKRLLIYIAPMILFATYVLWTEAQQTREWYLTYTSCGGDGC